MRKQAQSSLLDYLLQVMPELKDQKFRMVLRPMGKDPNAKKLYGLWSDASNKITDRKFRRPPTMSDSDVKSLVAAGLVEIHGKDIRVTSQGELTLRKMILDDDTFHLAPKDCQTCQRKVASVQDQPAVHQTWYTRYKDADVSAGN